MYRKILEMLPQPTELCEQMGDRSVNTSDNFGWTPLHEACNHGFEGIPSLIILFFKGAYNTELSIV